MPTMQSPRIRSVNTGATQQHSKETVRVFQSTPLQHNGTTRSFPRTLDQAFNHGADYGCSIIYYKNHWSWANRAVAFILWVLALAYGVTLWT
jgi:hypothetical protein